MKAIRLAICVLAGGLLGCQTYDFEPVTPLAISQTTQTTKVVGKQLKPNLMLLLDKSGSMTSQTTPGNTRIGDLKTAMADFLTNHGTIARVGVSIFPPAIITGGSNTNQCQATGQGEVLVQLPAASPSDDDATLQTQSNTVNQQISTINPGGGTPTADSLRFVGTLDELQDPDRQNFVLLLTDGVPNCNTMPVAGCGNGCVCTQATCAGSGPSCNVACLNDVDTENAVNELHAKNIKTIVVGFGADTAQASAYNTLNTMAKNGGFARACPMGTNAECSTGSTMDTCDTASKLCNQSFFQAADAAELSDALAAISAGIDPSQICTYVLDQAPSDPSFLSVFINGAVQPRCNAPTGCDTWTYDQTTGQPKVTFQGKLCDQVKNATPKNPVGVEFRIVDKI